MHKNIKRVTEIEYYVALLCYVALLNLFDICMIGTSKRERWTQFIVSASRKSLKTAKLIEKEKALFAPLPSTIIQNVFKTRHEKVY